MEILVYTVANNNQKNESFKKTVARSLPRHDQVVISRIITIEGHKNAKLTHQYLLNKEDLSICDSCKVQLTVEHMIVQNCAENRHINGTHK